MLLRTALEVGRQVVARVRCTGCPRPSSQLEPVLVHDAAEHVTPNSVFLGELVAVHQPQLVRLSYTQRLACA